ncbi:MAG: hypothetical protein ACP5XB_08035 [Isosphaeraceae bacterium]
MAKVVLDDLDDLAVLVLFSVFEATVRTHAGAEVDREIAQISHVAVLEAVRDLKEAIANGSFAKVIKAYKGADVDLTERVNQVREFRNWVAHGRRDAPRNNVTPSVAFERLEGYLRLLVTSSPRNQTPFEPVVRQPTPSVQPPRTEQPPEA